MPESYNHLHFKSVGSTNDLCRDECKKQLKPILITADKQTAGRGRNQKKWESPLGNISFSYGFFCNKPHNTLSLLAGLKTTIAVNKIFNKSLELKWPNDLIYKSKKVGGILIESENFEDRFLTIVGIGLNLKVKPTEAHWGDLNEELDNEEKKLRFTKELAHQIAQLENFSDKNWTKDWVEKCAHMDKKIKIPANKKEFLFIGVDENGAALLKNTNGEVFTYQESSLSVFNLY
jgi:BirA family biotin operon repressor/biotin-[acetyl-CoA-carboxylase] ligase